MGQVQHGSATKTAAVRRADVRRPRSAKDHPCATCRSKTREIERIISAVDSRLLRAETLNHVQLYRGALRRAHWRQLINLVLQMHMPRKLG